MPRSPEPTSTITARKRTLLVTPNDDNKQEELVNKRSKLDDAMDFENSIDEQDTNDIDLYRILAAMERDPQPIKMTPLDIRMRADLCQSLAQKQNTNVDTKLKNRIQTACHKANEIATKLESENKDDTNPVDRIFFGQHNNKNKQPSKETETAATNASVVSTTGSDEPTKTKQSISGTTQVASNKDNDKDDLLAKKPTYGTVSDLQKQQREQMEEAVAQMASQMKQQTEQIHTKLQNQNVNLNEMETVATNNVDAVTNVANATQEHVSKSWKRTTATWTMFFMIVGAFIWALITIQIAPKGSCLFFCNNPAIQTPAARKKQKQFCRTLPGGKQECIDIQSNDVNDLSNDIKVEEEKQPIQEEKIINKEKPQQIEKDVEEQFEEEEEEELMDSYYDDDSVEEDEEEEIVEPQYDEPVEDDEIEEEDYEEDHHYDESHESIEEEEEAEIIESPQYDESVEQEEEKIEDDDHYYDENDESVEEEEEEEIVEPQQYDETVEEEEELEEEYQEEEEEEIPVEEQQQPEYYDDDEVAEEDDDDEQPYIEENNVEEEEEESAYEEEATADNAADESVYEQQEETATTAEEPTMNETPPPQERPHEDYSFSYREAAYAAASGNFKSVRSYIEERPAVLYESDPNGWTLLHEAARNGKTEVVRILITKGCDVHKQTLSGHTALNLALQNNGPGHPVSKLLKHYMGIKDEL